MNLRSSGFLTRHNVQNFAVPILIAAMLWVASTERDYQNAAYTRRLVVDNIEVQSKNDQALSLKSLDGLCRYQGHTTLDEKGWKISVSDGGCTKTPSIDDASFFSFLKCFVKYPAMTALPEPEWHRNPPRQGDTFDLSVY